MDAEKFVKLSKVAVTLNAKSKRDDSSRRREALIEKYGGNLPNVPTHVLEGHHSSWARHFAWLPVRTEQRVWVWLRYTWRRKFWPAGWFCVPGPVAEYSDVRKGLWEV